MSPTMSELENELTEETSFGGTTADIERNQKMVDENNTETLDRWYAGAQDANEAFSKDIYQTEFAEDTLETSKEADQWMNRYYKLLEVLNTFKGK